MRKTLCALTLISALGCPALAGEMHTPPPAPQGEIHNPPPTGDSQELTAQGDIQYGQLGAAAVLALNLLRGVLGLF